MLLKNLNIGSRVLIGSALVSVLSVGLILPLALSKLATLSDQAEMRELGNHYLALTGEIRSQGELAQSLSAVLAHMPIVQRLFAEGDREGLAEITRPIFDNMSQQHAVRQFQFLLPPATSFLRVHMLDRHGDDLSAIRKTILEANRSQKPVRGLERGVAGLGVRGVEPVFYQGRHIGVVEFGMSFGQAFFERFKENTGVDAGLQIPDGSGFKTFASTLDDGTLFTPDQLKRIMAGEVLVQRLDLKGVPVAVYGRQVDDFSGNPVGVLELALDRSEVVAVHRSALFSILGVGVLLILGGLLLAWITARGISRPIRNTMQRLAAIAEGDGDLTLRLPADGRNELADLARAFNTFVGKIQTLVARLSGVSAKLSSAAEELSVNSGETNRQVKDEQHETDQVATAINEMTATVEEVARNAAEAARLVREAHVEAESGDAMARQAVDVIESLATEIEQVRQVVARLSGDSEEIGAVLDVIRGVAEQTNLLALNAAIEAARAGEQGRGFAVVADEVRTLAIRTRASTEDIREKIERVQVGASGVVQAIGTSEERAMHSVEDARRASESFKRISTSVTALNDMNTQIANAAEEQLAVTEEVNRNIHHITKTVDQTASGSENLAQASDALAHLAAEMQEQIGHFRV